MTSRAFLMGDYGEKSGSERPQEGGRGEGVDRGR